MLSRESLVSLLDSNEGTIQVPCGVLDWLDPCAPLLEWRNLVPNSVEDATVLLSWTMSSKNSPHVLVLYCLYSHLGYISVGALIHSLLSPKNSSKTFAQLDRICAELASSTISKCDVEVVNRCILWILGKVSVETIGCQYSWLWDRVLFVCASEKATFTRLLPLLCNPGTKFTYIRPDTWEQVVSSVGVDLISQILLQNPGCTGLVNIATTCAESFRIFSIVDVRLTQYVCDIALSNSDKISLNDVLCIASQLLGIDEYRTWLLRSLNSAVSMLRAGGQSASNFRFIVSQALNERTVEELAILDAFRVDGAVSSTPLQQSKETYSTALANGIRYYETRDWIAFGETVLAVESFFSKIYTDKIVLGEFYEFYYECAYFKSQNHIQDDCRSLSRITAVVCSNRTIVDFFHEKLSCISVSHVGILFPLLISYPSASSLDLLRDIIFNRDLTLDQMCSLITCVCNGYLDLFSDLQSGCPSQLELRHVGYVPMFVLGFLDWCSKSNLRSPIQKIYTERFRSLDCCIWPLSFDEWLILECKSIPASLPVDFVSSAKTRIADNPTRSVKLLLKHLVSCNNERFCCMCLHLVSDLDSLELIGAAFKSLLLFSPFESMLTLLLSLPCSAHMHLFPTLLPYLYPQNSLSIFSISVDTSVKLYSLLVLTPCTSLVQSYDILLPVIAMSKTREELIRLIPSFSYDILLPSSVSCMTHLILQLQNCSLDRVSDYASEIDSMEISWKENMGTLLLLSSQDKFISPECALFCTRVFRSLINLCPSLLLCSQIQEPRSSCELLCLKPCMSAVAELYLDAVYQSRCIVSEMILLRGAILHYLNLTDSHGLWQEEGNMTIDTFMHSFSEKVLQLPVTLELASDKDDFYFAIEVHAEKLRAIDPHLWHILISHAR